MNKKLERFEAQLREIFEEKIIHLIPGNHDRRKLFDDLKTALQDNLVEGSQGEIKAPDCFTVLVPPEDLSDWKAHQDVLDEMADFLYRSGLSHGFTFNQQLTINLKSQDRDFKQDFLISANFTKKQPNLPDTAVMPNDNTEKEHQNIPDRAYLIVGGKDNYQLEKAVINIGRHSDNNLIINEPHVSRHHAQLRAINNRYVIFDVGSTGGLLINGKPTSQSALHPGDVIRIGLVNLIYVQDSTAEQPTTALPVDEDLGHSENNPK